MQQIKELENIFVPTTKSTESHTIDDMQARYNPFNGFYISRHQLKADYQADIDNLQMQQLPCSPEQTHHLQDRNTDDIFRIISLRSIDGTNDNHLVANAMASEEPADYTYTPAYYNSPNLQKCIDWFQVDKARIRIFRQLPGANVQMHHDFDNERHNFDPNNITVRIIVNLGDTDSYYQLVNDSCDVTFKLEKGQFTIINTDFVWHATKNLDDEPRNTMNIICKWNAWLEEITAPQKELMIEKVQL